MPRLSPRLFHRARKANALLPLILHATRDLESAKNEFRWLKEHALSQVQQRDVSRGHVLGWRHVLRKLCHERSRGKPLQYLIGTEYFGDLEITCRPGVLIPRQETAASVTHLVQRLKTLPAELRVLDLCTGTGCIPLLFHHELQQAHLGRAETKLLGVDLSPKAIDLANFNLELQQKQSNTSVPVDFAKADVFPTKEVGIAPSVEDVLHDQSSKWDILISNPPYISPEAFNSTTTRSVRNFEPRLALVPEGQHYRHGIDPGDVFYPRLLDIASKMSSNIVLFEVADMHQALRVARMVRNRDEWEGVEIWRDNPDPAHDIGVDREQLPTDCPAGIKVLGHGNGRSVFAWKGEAREWLGIEQSA